ncbi:hypothetical protein N0V88_005987 [Collariella sp. IMI 366227]|nr:hypothetical protein N0V88_005987 [Collariella sp. IMI 366227]
MAFLNKGNSTLNHPGDNDSLVAGRYNLLMLPVEVLGEICSHMCGHCCLKNEDVANLRGWHRDMRPGQVALSQMSKTCRALRAMVQPFLFHALIPSDRYSGRSFFRFMRTLVERPDLRDRVLEAIVTASDIGWPSFRRSDTSIITDTIAEHLGKGDWAPLWEAIKLAQTSDDEKIIPDKFAALTSLLLHLAPNLKRANLTLPRLAHDTTREGATEIPATFPTGDHSLDPTTATTTPLFPNLTTLTFSWNRMPFASLRNLTATIGPHLSKVLLVQQSNHIEVHEAVEALKPFKASLKELIVFYRGDRWCKAQRPVALREFTALQTFKVESHAFDWKDKEASKDMFVEILPPQIRRLGVIGYAPCAPALKNLMLAVKAGEFPDLEFVRA